MTTDPGKSLRIWTFTRRLLDTGLSKPKVTLYYLPTCLLTDTCPRLFLSNKSQRDEEANRILLARRTLTRSEILWTFPLAREGKEQDYQKHHVYCILYASVSLWIALSRAAQTTNKPKLRLQGSQPVFRCWVYLISGCLFNADISPS